MKGNSYFSVRGIHATALLACCAVLLPASSAANIFLRMQTDLGGVDIELFDTTPATRDNLLLYVNSDSYDDTFIHRRASLDTSGVDVLQMGGFVFDPALGAFANNSGIFHIPEFAPVANEPGIFNTRGTIAMARLGGQPDSATSEFFINLVDNPVLDTLDGGFAVFGQVVRGMDVIDEISALQRCGDILFSPFVIPCGNYPDVPLIGVTSIGGAGILLSAPIEEPNLVNLLNIGVDNDGDGIIDKVEDAAPNSGDGDNDSFQDSTQASVASFTGFAGNYVTLVTSPAVSLYDTVVLGNTFFLTTQDPNNVLDQVRFPDAIFAPTLTGVAVGGPATVNVALVPTSVINAYFLYGATPTDNLPHWYEFDYDGETGAEISGNNVILHFVDGKRGDNDLQADGIIEKSPGAPARKPDNDGVSSAVEDAAPNNGDGNGDNIPDSFQDHVTSLRDVRGNYVTLEAVSPAHTFTSVIFSRGISPAPTVFPAWLNNLNLLNGFLYFNLDGVTPGGPAEVRLILPVGENPVTFVKYGPELGDATDHFHEFLYDPASGTGAEINSNIVTLHFVDGGRGDFDLTANGMITDPGAPALDAPPVPLASSGSGCSLQPASGSPWQAGAWWLLGLCLLSAAIRRMRQQLYLPAGFARCAASRPESPGG